MFTIYIFVKEHEQLLQYNTFNKLKQNVTGCSQSNMTEKAGNTSRNSLSNSKDWQLNKNAFQTATWRCASAHNRIQYLILQFPTWYTIYVNYKLKEMHIVKIFI